MKTFKQFVEQLSIYGQVRHGSTAATATDKSVSSAVDKSLENLPTGGKEFHSASHETGKTGITGSGYIQYSGSLNPKPPPSPSSGAPAKPPAKPGTPTPPAKPGNTTTPKPVNLKLKDKEPTEVKNMFNKGNGNGFKVK